MYYRITPELLDLIHRAKHSIVAATNDASTPKQPRPAVVPTPIGTLSLAYYVLAEIEQQPHMESAPAQEQPR